MRKTARLRLAMLIAAGIVSLAVANITTTIVAEDYPSRPIKLLVPGTAGGGMDVIARVIANSISESLGQTVVVENKPGAAGNIAVDQLARSAPDGYTLVVGQTSQLAINPSLYPKLPYDPLKDFAPIVLLADAPNVVVVSGKSPIKSLADMVKAAKDSPDGLDFATPGAGTVSHLTGELFQRTAGIKLRHIPYKGAASAVTDVAGERIPVLLSSIPTSMALIQGGQLRPIAVSAIARSPALPDVPTIAEQGYPGFDAGTWYGLLAPAGTPADVVARLNAAANEALKSPDVIKKVLAEGCVVLGGTSETFAEKLRADNVKWGKIVREAGVTID